MQPTGVASLCASAGAPLSDVVLIDGKFVCHASDRRSLTLLMDDAVTRSHICKEAAKLVCPLAKLPSLTEGWHSPLAARLVRSDLPCCFISPAPATPFAWPRLGQPLTIAVIRPLKKRQVLGPAKPEGASKAAPRPSLHHQVCPVNGRLPITVSRGERRFLRALRYLDSSYGVLVGNSDRGCEST